MRKLSAFILALGIMCLWGCAGKTYGVSSDGTFPPKPAGASYPSWEHICAVFDSSNATELLQKSGEAGWEMVGMGMQGNDSLICFKRPKP